MNDKPASESPEVVTSKGIGSSAWLDEIVSLCHDAEVKAVYASDQHGMGFLLAEHPGKNANGIVFRNDTVSYKEMKRLAEMVNAALSNGKVCHERSELAAPLG